MGRAFVFCDGGGGSGGDSNEERRSHFFRCVSGNSRANAPSWSDLTTLPGEVLSEVGDPRGHLGIFKAGKGNDEEWKTVAADNKYHWVGEMFRLSTSLTPLSVNMEESSLVEYCPLATRDTVAFPV